MTPSRINLYGGVATAVLLAAAGGFGLAKMTADKPPASKVEPAEAEPSETAKLDIALKPQAITEARIEVEQVRSGGLAAEILAQATVAASPNGQAVLTAPAAGTLTRIFKRLGDPVRAGETLAVVESREAAQLTADRSTAAAKVLLAQRNLAREKSLYEQRVSPKVDYERAQAEAAAAAAEARRAQVSAGTIHVTADGRGVAVRSPISGRVTAASANLGAFIQPETELFRISDPQRVQVEASVSGLDAPRITSGDRALLELPDGRTVEGRVRAVTPALDPQTRSATAVLDVAAVGLQPGQIARARLFPRGGGASRAIAVPEAALQSVGGRDVVFVRTSTGFHAQQVQVGQRSAGRAEIVVGLAPGQVVATRNAFVLKAELGKGSGEED
jgi:cobalt-zinc-cadmium efflux system membrane fusion protein